MKVKIEVICNKVKNIPESTNIESETNILFPVLWELYLLLQEDQQSFAKEFLLIEDKLADRLAYALFCQNEKSWKEYKEKQKLKTQSNERRCEL